MKIQTRRNRIHTRRYRIHVIGVTRLILTGYVYGKPEPMNNIIT
jgi:hypothetical protein